MYKIRLRLNNNNNNNNKRVILIIDNNNNNNYKNRRKFSKYFTNQKINKEKLNFN